MTNINININTDTLRQALNGDEEAIKEAQSLLPAPRPEDVFEFDPAYTYRDCDEAVWSYYAPNRAWICKDSRGWHIRADSVPPTRFGPYTRIEKENDHAVTRTTDDWASLLDGTTPAPWGWEWDQGILASAPEAVAEVIRLREKLEERIRVWLIVADKLDNRGLAAEADVTRIHTEELTSILEGHTDE